MDAHDEIPPSKEWRCFRCGLVSPSPDASGRPPISCLEAFGGCSRDADPPIDETDEDTISESASSGTRFFPADWSQAKTDLPLRALLSEGQRLFREMVREIEKYFIFQSPVHSRLTALFIFQSYFVRPVLPCVFYLGVGGPPSAGKTTLLEILKDLCWNGIMSGDVKVAALSRLLDRGCTLFADEADAMDEDQRDLIYGSARRGYRRGSTRIVSIQSGKNWEPQVINIYGAYGFSFYNDADVDPALLSRMVKFDVVRLKTDIVKERVFLNMARVILGQTDLQKRIGTYADAKAKEWTPEKAAAHLMEPTFQARVAASTGVTDLPRDVEIVAVMLLVADIVGLDIVEETKAIFTDGSRSIDENALDELETVHDIFAREIEESAKKGKDPRMRFEDVRHEWNLKRKQYGDRAETASEFKRRLGGLGLRAGNELVHPKNRSYIVWTQYLEAKLSGSPNPSGETDLTQYLASPNPPDQPLTRVRGWSGG